MNLTEKIVLNNKTKKDFNFEYFKESPIAITWKTVFVGRQLGLVDEKLLDQFATHSLLDNEYSSNKYILELASGISDGYYMDRLLEGLFQSLSINILEDTDEWEIEVRKWRFLFLKSSLINSLDNEELLGKIEDVYCSFYHPAVLSQFASYMPPDPHDLHDYSNYSQEEYMAYRVEQFRIFLNNEQNNLSNE